METIQSLKQYAIKKLKDSYDQREIESICKIIYTDLFGFSVTDLILNRNQSLSDEQITQFRNIVSQLELNIPIQYIIGWSEFAGLKFRLNRDTLIPRPETEELVMLVSNYVTPGLRILDIGTGSGCIAVTLAHLNPNSIVEAVDISAHALEQAAQNAETNQTQVRFQQTDILEFENYSWSQYDIIVSNPPYIRMSEKSAMEDRVLKYEPHRALFVSEQDPLIFYRRIAELGLQYLTPKGYLFFEINEALGEEMIKLLTSLGYCHLSIHQDIHGRDRIIQAQKGH